MTVWSVPLHPNVPGCLLIRTDIPRVTVSVSPGPSIETIGVGAGGRPSPNLARGGPFRGGSPGPFSSQPTRRAPTAFFAIFESGVYLTSSPLFGASITLPLPTYMTTWLTGL